MWNPFSHLIDSPYYYRTKILTSSLKDRFLDTFIAFQGDLLSFQNQRNDYEMLRDMISDDEKMSDEQLILHHQKKTKILGVDIDDEDVSPREVMEAIMAYFSKRRKLGILDYIFPIPALCRAISMSIMHNEIKKAMDADGEGQDMTDSSFPLYKKILIGFFATVWQVTDFAKSIVSAGLTIALTPVIILSHLATLPFYYSLLRKVKSLKVFRGNRMLDLKDLPRYIRRPIEIKSLKDAKETRALLKKFDLGLKSPKKIESFFSEEEQSLEEFLAEITRETSQESLFAAKESVSDEEDDSLSASYTEESSDEDEAEGNGLLKPPTPVSASELEKGKVTEKANEAAAVNVPEIAYDFEKLMELIPSSYVQVASGPDIDDGVESGRSMSPSASPTGSQHSSRGSSPTRHSLNASTGELEKEPLSPFEGAETVIFPDAHMRNFAMALLTEENKIALDAMLQLNKVDSQSLFCAPQVKRFHDRHLSSPIVVGGPEF